MKDCIHCERGRPFRIVTWTGPVTGRLYSWRLHDTLSHESWAPGPVLCHAVRPGEASVEGVAG